MVFKSFDEVIEKVKGYPERKTYGSCGSRR